MTLQSPNPPRRSAPAGALQPVAIVSNHVSWADILIHMAHSFPSFAARDGTQNLPMIGLVSQKMQCVYVNRGDQPAKEGGSGNGNGSGNGAASSSDSDATRAAKAEVGAGAPAALARSHRPPRPAAAGPPSHRWQWERKAAS